MKYALFAIMVICMIFVAGCEVTEPPVQLEEMAGSELTEEQILNIYDDDLDAALADLDSLDEATQ